MKKGRIYIGTSGWQYKHWRGKFYPEGLKIKDEFEYYSRYFDTVEINNSFYRLPTKEIFSRWKMRAPENFLYAVKGSRFITHMKKLNGTRQTFHKFFSHTGRLGDKLGPILFQLPPRWKVNLERFSNFLKILHPKYRYSFEFREHSWYNEEVYKLLKQYNCSFCIYELDRHLSPVLTTADFIYLRLHGPGGKYQGSYKNTILKNWAKQIMAWQKQGKDVFVYFDNDQEGYAVLNAIRLKAYCGLRNSN